MVNNPKTFRAACVQMRSGLDRHQNTKDAIALIEHAAAGGAEFILTPEMTNIVDRKAARMLADLPGEDDLAEIGAFSQTAKRLGVWLLIGSLAVRAPSGKAANRSYFFAPDGSVVTTYDKLHMFDVDLPGGESWKESKVYEAGSETRLVETPIGAFGLSICYDVRFPGLYRTLARAGAEILCVPAAFTRQTGQAHWKTLLTARAIETGSFVIAAAQGGDHEDGRETWGHSVIIDPWGETLAQSDNDKPGVIFADILTQTVHTARQRIPNLSLEQNFKVSIVSV